MHATRMVRGHFVSFLYHCRLTGNPAGHLKFRTGQPQAGDWAWHDVCPVDILPVNDRLYKDFF
jgi:colanic acid biosynthesis protein WcaH